MDQERTYKWIQDRLRDLHSGRLSEADRLRLEEIAKSDPFIKDALEGYRSHADQDHSALLKVLSERIQNKNVSRRPKLLPLSRGWVLQAVAASLVLILATWVVIYYVEKQDQGSFVAVEPDNIPAAEHSTEVQLTDPENVNENLAVESDISNEVKDEPAGLRGNAQAKAREHTLSKANTGEKDEAKAKAEAKDKERIVTDADTKKSNDYTSVEHVTSEPANVPAAKESGNISEQAVSDQPVNAGAEQLNFNSQRDQGYYANQMNPVLMNQRVTGKVIGQRGESLIGALITIPNTNLVTTTDLFGKFEFYLPESTSPVEIVNTGYRDTTLILSQGQEDVVIVLDEKNIDLPSGVLAGSESKQQRFRKENEDDANPTDTSLSFADYLNSNSRFTIQNNYSPTAKEVNLRFKISADGRPDNIQVIKSSTDKKYVNESIRLIQKGPDWSCDGGVYPCEKVYTIYFQ